MSKYLKEIIIFYFVLTLHTLYSQELTTFAVFNLKNFGILESESAIISERLRDILVSLNKYRVLERENMDEILNEQGFQLSGCTTNECAVEAGKLLNVNKIITGSVGKFSSIFTITLKIIDVETAEIEKSIFYEHTGIMEDLLYSGINNSLNKLLFGKDNNMKSSILSHDIKEGINVGNKIYSLQFNTLSDKKYNLDDLFQSKKSNIVILHFWISYSRQCSNSFPFLVELKQKYRNKDIKIFHINSKQEKEDIYSFTKKNNIYKDDVVVDENKKVSILLKVEKEPTIFLLDSYGIIKNKLVGFKDVNNINDFENSINKLVGQ